GSERSELRRPGSQRWARRQVRLVLHSPVDHLSGRETARRLRAEPLDHLAIFAGKPGPRRAEWTADPPEPASSYNQNPDQPAISCGLDRALVGDGDTGSAHRESITSAQSRPPGQRGSGLAIVQWTGGTTGAECVIVRELALGAFLWVLRAVTAVAEGHRQLALA